MTERRNLLQESLATIERLQARLKASERPAHKPIAIVGAGCRFPGGAEEPEALWRLLRDGVDAVSEVPPDRWDVDAYYDPDPSAPGKMVTQRGGFLSQVDRFDPQFFGISPREAATHGPAAAAAARGGLGGARERRHQPPDRARGQRAPACSSASRRATTRSCCASAAPENSDVYSATGNALNAAAGRLAFTARPAGPERGGRHRLLVVAGGGAPGLPEPAHGRMRPGAGRRRERDPVARCDGAVLPSGA